MSKSPNPILPALGGAAIVMGGAYILADQFVVDLPAPARGAIEVVSAAQAQDTETPEPVDMAAADTGAPAQAQTGGLGLGRDALPEEVAAWDIDIRPDGQGLPAGEGDVWTGEELYIESCAMCHGDFGEGAGRWPQLSMGFGTLDAEDPVKTVGSYWPYASTVFDYVHRAMPFGNAQSLSDDDVYAITAYILYLNEVVEDDFVLSRDSFGEIEMPNAGNFYMDDRADTELDRFSGEVCMENCKDSVEIVMRARVLDVTPDSDGGGIDLEGGGGASMQESAAEPEAPAEEEAAAEPAAEEPAPAAEEVAAVDPALVEEGAMVFRKCQACHQVGPDAQNRVGPELNGLIGRTVAGVDGFSYSGAMQSAGEDGVIWTEEHLAEFLANPRETYQGTKMSFAGLRSEDEIAAVTAYIQSESPE
jgi:cytochrome c